MRKAWDDDSPESWRFRLKATAGLLTFYAALHLAVGALIQVLTLAEAMAAVAPVAWSPHAPASSASRSTAIVCSTDWELRT
jgi:hypothetical protein